MTLVQCHCEELVTKKSPNSMILKGRDYIALLVMTKLFFKWRSKN